MLLERLHCYITSEPFLDEPGFIAGLFKRKESLPSFSGLYLWGDVGRGKSMLMDLFFDTIPYPQKKRIHFHAFMRDVHARIFAWRKLKSDEREDLVGRVAKEIAQGCKVLCLDEIQVHDVTDAMILSKLFTTLFNMGVVVVFTSNRPPKDLYQGGLQREQFKYFIELCEKRLEIAKLESDTDYRLKQLKALDSTYYHPLGDEADLFLDGLYGKLTQGHASLPVTIEVQGRKLEVERTSGGVAWFTFHDLCERALGAADYIEVAAEFHTVLIQNIPQLTPEYRNEAKRFVTLIDALYEHKTNLICTAAAAPNALYPQGDGSFEFERTVSRLIEMQSEPYLQASHIAIS